MIRALASIWVHGRMGAQRRGSLLPGEISQVHLDSLEHLSVGMQHPYQREQYGKTRLRENMAYSGIQGLDSQ